MTAVETCSEGSFVSELLLIAVAFSLLLVLPIYLLWYSLGCAALMRLGLWRTSREPALSGKPLRRTMVVAALLVAVVAAVFEAMGTGILHARNRGLDDDSLVLLAVMFAVVAVLTKALLRLDLRGVLTLSVGMTLMLAITLHTVDAVFGGEVGSNPAPYLLAYAAVSLVMSFVALWAVAKWRPAAGREASHDGRTETG